MLDTDLVVFVCLERRALAKPFPYGFGLLEPVDTVENPSVTSGKGDVLNPLRSLRCPLGSGFRGHALHLRRRSRIGRVHVGPVDAQVRHRVQGGGRVELRRICGRRNLSAGW